MKLPRYVQQRYTPKGVRTYRFNPPRQLVDSGIVSRKELGQDFNEAKILAQQLNKLIDEHRERQLTDLSVTRSTTLVQLCDVYLLSNDFNALRDSSKADYIYFLNILCHNDEIRSTLKTLLYQVLNIEIYYQDLLHSNPLFL